MKKPLITALILFIIIPLCLGACAGAPTDEPLTDGASDRSFYADEDAPSGLAAPDAQDPREALLSAFRADGGEIKRSPVRSAVPRDYDSPDYYDFSALDAGLAGAYTLKFSDLDGDGEEELLVAGLEKSEEPFRLYGSDEDLPLYVLYLTVYDRLSDGEIVSDTVNTGADTSAVFNLEGTARCYVAEDGGTIALLRYFGYDTSDYTYTLYSYGDGRITERFSRSFIYTPGDMANGTATLLCGEEDPDADLSKATGIMDLFRKDTVTEGKVGSAEVGQVIADIRNGISSAGMGEPLFPLQPSGEIISGDAFDETCDLRFGNGYDPEREQIYLFIEDDTGTYEKIPAAMRVGGTRIAYVGQQELAEAHDSAGIEAEYDANEVSVRLYVGEHSGTYYAAVTPLVPTENGSVRLVDRDDGDNTWDISFTAGDAGRQTFEYTDIPDPGAMYGVAPSGFTAVDRLDGGTDFILEYDSSDPAFGGKTSERIVSEYAGAAEAAGFALTDSDDGSAVTCSRGGTEFTVTSYVNGDSVEVISLRFGT